MKVYTAIAKTLVDNGVNTMFGVIGDANLFFADSFSRDFQGRYVSASNESGAVLMALGYASVSGRLGVATTTYGPALTNTITALIEGVKGQKPVVVICGDTPADMRENLQDVPQRELVAPTGAGFEQARSPATIVYDLTQAIRRAQLERRPIVFNVPSTFQSQDIEYERLPHRLPDVRTWSLGNDDIDDAVGIIAAARRPIVLAGRGAVISGARESLIKLARRIEAPLATTLGAKDLFAGEDFNLGLFGTLSNPIAVDAIMSSDCVIAFGASLNRYTTSQGSFRKGKRIIQCNLEPSEVGKNFLPTAGVVGDPAQVAEIIVNYLDEAEIPPSGFRSAELDASLKRFSWESDAPDRSTSVTVDVRRALIEIDKALPKDRVVVVDGGRFMTEPYKVMGVNNPRDFVFTSNTGSIGLGLSYAIGAGCAAPDKPVIVVMGDGGFMLGGLAEYNTAVRHGIDLIVVLCNDSAYGAEHIQFRDRNMDPAISIFAWPDFEQVAKALGGTGFTVRTMKDLANALEDLKARSGPTLLDIKLDPDRMPDRPR